MIRFAFVLVAALAFVGPSVAQSPPIHQVTYHNGQYFHQGKVVPASLFGLAEQRQIQQMMQMMQAQNAAQISALQQQIAANNAAQQQLIAFLLQKQSAPAAPPPINIYLPPGYGQPYQGPKLDLNPGVPKLDPNPGVPKLDPNPGVPKLDPNPGIPKVDPNPGTPKLDPKPGPAPKLDPNPGPIAIPPPVGYQRFTYSPPVLTATIRRPDGTNYVVPVYQPQ